MFNSEELRNAVPVRLALIDGRLLEGSLMLPMDVKFKRILNSDLLGVEFQTEDGTESVIAKSAIVEIVEVKSAEAEAPVAEPEPAAEGADVLRDAFTTLGISASATAEQARAAYDTLRMEFHPDRYAKIGLPKDVFDYVVTKSQKIDAAYKAISSRATVEMAEAG